MFGLGLLLSGHVRGFYSGEIAADEWKALKPRLQARYFSKPEDDSCGEGDGGQEDLS